MQVHIKGLGRIINSRKQPKLDKSERARLKTPPDELCECASEDLIVCSIIQMPSWHFRKYTPVLALKDCIATLANIENCLNINGTLTILNICQYCFVIFVFLYWVYEAVHAEFIGKTDEWGSVLKLNSAYIEADCFSQSCSLNMVRSLKFSISGSGKNVKYCAECGK
jgi:hypothetical protein